MGNRKRFVFMAVFKVEKYIKNIVRRTSYYSLTKSKYGYLYYGYFI